MSEAPAYQRFFAELKRRKVFRVAAAYGAAAFVVIQAADVIFPAIPLPEWTVSFVVWLSILGFPFALVFAWVFERTPEGIQRTPDAAEDEIEAIVSQPVSRRWPSGIAALAGIVLLAAGVWTAWRVAVPDEPSVALEESRLAVFPFGIVGSENLNWLREGMPTLLSQNLFEPGEIETVDPVLVMNATRSGDGLPIDVRKAESVSRDLGAGRFVVGTVQGAGGRVRMNASLYALQDSIQALARAEVEGDTTELFQLVDRLTAELLAERSSGEFGAASEGAVRTAAVTTGSLTALKAYLEGEELLRRGELPEAREAFARAVELDSTFALAMYRHAFALQVGLGDVAGEATEWVRRASRHADHLSEFDRRSLAAFTDHLEGRIGEAERAYRDLASDYPSRLDARVLLTLLLAQYDPLRGRPLNEAMELLQAIGEADPGYVCMQCVAQQVYITAEEMEGLSELGIKGAAAIPDSAERARMTALMTAFRDLSRRDEEEFGRARAEVLPQLVPEEGWYRGFPWTALWSGQPALADTIARVDFAALELPAGERERTIAQLDFVRGRWDRASDRIGRVFEENPDPTLLDWVTAWAVHVPLDAEIEGLEAAADRCLAWQGSVSRWSEEQWRPLAAPVAQYGAALMRLQAGDAETALALADSLEALPVDSLYLPAIRNAARLVRAEARLRSGADSAAVAILDDLEWEMAPATALVNFELVASRAHLVLAEAAWRSGDPATSRKWLENGLTLWQAEDYALRELRRGQTSEVTGDLEAARIHYARVIEALEPADESPILTERREEARSRLTALMADEG